jgi:hypothetical protein
MARGDAHIRIRLNHADRDRLKEVAAKNRRTMNSEIAMAVSAWLAATTGEGLETQAPAVAPDCAALPGDTHQP